MFFVFSCLRGYAVDWVMVLDLTEEQRSFKESIEQFARETIAPQAARIDESGEFPIDLIRASAAHGLLGVTIPPAWGGAGRDYVSYALAIEAVARASATVAAALVVTNSLVAELIAYAGSDAQKEQWLRALATGEALGAFALSEPNAGHRRRQPADDGGAGAADGLSGSGAGRCGWPTRRPRRSRSSSPARTPGLCAHRRA